MRPLFARIAVGHLNDEGDVVTHYQIRQCRAIVPIDGNVSLLIWFRGCDGDMLLFDLVYPVPDTRFADAMIVSGPKGDSQFAAKSGMYILFGFGKFHLRFFIRLDLQIVARALEHVPLALLFPGEGIGART